MRTFFDADCSKYEQGLVRLQKKYAFLKRYDGRNHLKFATIQPVETCSSPAGCEMEATRRK